MKLDAEPLVRFCERKYQPRNEDYRANTGITEVVSLMTGTSRNTVLRWLKEGVSVWNADRIAIKRLGVHPSAVWPDWFDLSRESIDS